MFGQESLTTDERLARLEESVKKILEYIEAKTNQQIKMPLDPVSVQVIKDTFGI